MTIHGRTQEDTGTGKKKKNYVLVGSVDWIGRSD